MFGRELGARRSRSELVIDATCGAGRQRISLYHAGHVAFLFFSFFFFFLFFQDRVSQLCSLGCPRTHYVGQAGLLTHRDSLILAFEC